MWVTVSAQVGTFRRSIVDASGRAKESLAWVKPWAVIQKFKMFSTIGDGKWQVQGVPTQVCAGLVQAVKKDSAYKHRLRIYVHLSRSLL